jgi:hypothetical protein
VSNGAPEGQQVPPEIVEAFTQQVTKILEGTVEHFISEVTMALISAYYSGVQVGKESGPTMGGKSFKAAGEEWKK